jgi:hypothetical protein
LPSKILQDPQNWFQVAVSNEQQTYFSSIRPVTAANNRSPGGSVRNPAPPKPGKRSHNGRPKKRTLSESFLPNWAPKKPSGFEGLRLSRDSKEESLLNVLTKGNAKPPGQPNGNLSVSQVALASTKERELNRILEEPPPRKTVAPLTRTLTATRDENYWERSSCEGRQALDCGGSDVECDEPVIANSNSAVAVVPSPSSNSSKKSSVVDAAKLAREHAIEDTETNSTKCSLCGKTGFACETSASFEEHIVRCHRNKELERNFAEIDSALKPVSTNWN